jgi:hypothetical protein
MAGLSEGLGSRREDNIKAVDRGETKYEVMNWIHLSHYKFH